jgi:hypothetical protein
MRRPTWSHEASCDALWVSTGRERRAVVVVAGLLGRPVCAIAHSSMDMMRDSLAVQLLRVFWLCQTRSSEFRAGPSATATVVPSD